MSKHCLNNIVMACLLFFFFTLAGIVSAAEFASVNQDGVIIRASPDGKAEALWEVFKGFPLEVVKKQKNWVKVIDFEGAGGWIATQYLASTRTVIIKAKTANLRVGPGINYEEIALVKYGVVFEPLAKEAEWYKVRHEEGGIAGWIHSDLLWPDTP